MTKNICEVVFELGKAFGELDAENAKLKREVSKLKEDLACRDAVIDKHVEDCKKLLESNEALMDRVKDMHHIIEVRDHEALDSSIKIAELEKKYADLALVTSNIEGIFTRLRKA